MVMELQDAVLWLFAAYVAFLLSAAHSGKIQRFCQYLTWTSKHKNGSLQNLRALGLQHNTRNISLTTEDGIKLNGYHIIPSKHAPEVNSIHLKEIGDKSNRRTSLDRFFSNELIKTKTVFLYFHGIAHDRAFHYRIDTMMQLCNHFDAHVIAFDYRGFGDNEGAPTEDGTRLDARACSKWLDNALKGNENVMKILYGHSLGSSIGAFLLADKNFGAKYDGFIMNGAFSCGDDAMSVMKMSSFLRIIPPLFNYVLRNWRIITKGYNTLEAIKDIDTQLEVVMIHGTNDITVPYTLGQKLYAAWQYERSLIQKKNGIIKKSASITFVTLEGGLHSDNYKYSAWTNSIHNLLQSIERKGK